MALLWVVNIVFPLFGLSCMCEFNHFGERLLPYCNLQLHEVLVCVTVCDGRLFLAAFRASISRPF